MLIQDELMHIVPSVEEKSRKRDTALKILRLVREEIAMRPTIIDAELGGSYAKGTWLSGADIDVFVRFDRSVPDNIFRETSIEVGFAAMREYGPYRRYADHPYVEAAVDGTVVNVVPFYDVELGNWISAADRSPYHTTYMQKHLTEAMRNEVRLLKKFLKVHDIYGAQTEKGGFSGYAAESLVLYCGGFTAVMETIARAENGSVLGQGARKFQTPITILDPIDNNRNLAAAISNRNMGIFMMACKAFQERLSGSALSPREYHPKVDWDCVVAAAFPYTARSPEIIWGQAKSATVAMARQLNKSGFHITRYHTVVDDHTVYSLFLPESMNIPPRYTRSGPSVFRHSSAAKFVEANRDSLVWVTDNMDLASLKDRTHTDIYSLLRWLLSNPKKTGIPAGIHRDIEDYRVITGPCLSGEVKDKALSILSTDHIDPAA